MAIAVDWLRRGELDAAIVGAVDFAGDDRAALARGSSVSRHPERPDSAVCLVLKRLDDARRDGDRVYALIRDIATATRRCRRDRRVRGGDRPGRGRPGGGRTPRSDPDPRPINRPGSGCRNRADGPRRTTVEATNLGGKGIDASSSRKMPASEAAVTAPRAAHRDAPIRTLRPRRGRRRGDPRTDRRARSNQSGASRRVDRRDGPAMVASSPRRSAVAAGAGDRRRWCRIRSGISSLRTMPRERPPGRSDPRRRHEAPRGVAFVYPGLGNYFEGMGRELGLLWPEVLHRQDRGERLAPRPARARGLVEPAGSRAVRRTTATPILGQVAVGSLVTDVLLGLGIAPDAAIGYSMGESAALVALRAWTNRDELAGRLQSSPLFATQLSGPCEAARRAWEYPARSAGRLGRRDRPEVGRRCAMRRSRPPGRAAFTS